MPVLLALALALPAFAEPDDAAPIDAAPVDAPVDAAPVDTCDDACLAARAELAGLHEALAAAGDQVSASEADRAGLVLLVEQAAALLDDRRPSAERVAAAIALGASGDVRALPFLRAGVVDRQPDVRAASLDAALSFGSAEAVAVAERLIREAHAPPSVREAGVDGLGGLPIPEAGALLWTLAGDRSVPAWMRVRARSVLEASHPDVLAARGEPGAVSNALGAAAGVAANGVLGGVLLGSVGSWGQFEGGAALGAVGGSAVGVGTGVLYATAQPVTVGQGFAYASGVGWGLTSGVLAANAALGREQYLDWGDVQRRQTLAPAAWALGTAAGAGIGLLPRDPDPWDVVEVDFAGYLGSALALSVVDLAAGRVPDEYYVRWPGDDADFDDYMRENRRWQLANGRLRSGVTLIGVAAGLGGGLALADAWDLDIEDGLFAAVVGAQAAIVGASWPAAVGLNEQGLRGTLRLPLHLSVIGALALAEVRPVDARASAVGAYGLGMGNALGGGLPLLAGADGRATVARVMIPLGIAGTAGGILAADLIDPQAGDWSMIAVGVPIATANAAALGSFLDGRGLIGGSQAGGLALTTLGASGVGLLALGGAVEPKVGDMVLLGTAAAWGGWYGALVPVAVGAEWRGDEVALSGALVADAFVAAGGLALGPKIGLEPRRTVVPQMLGLTGGTVGALSGALASRDVQDVALGAVIGSTLGLGGGALLARGKAPPQVSVRGLELPGTWTPVLAPTPDGVRVGVQAVGW